MVPSAGRPPRRRSKDAPPRSAYYLWHSRGRSHPCLREHAGNRGCVRRSEHTPGSLCDRLWKPRPDRVRTSHVHLSLTPGIRRARGVRPAVGAPGKRSHALCMAGGGHGPDGVSSDRNFPLDRSHGGWRSWMPTCSISSACNRQFLPHTASAFPQVKPSRGEAFRHRCGGSGAHLRTCALAHFRTFALSHFPKSSAPGR
jgi:hypothetical protein